MIAASLRALAPTHVLARAGWGRTAWPVVGGSLAFVAGLLMLACAALFYRQAGQLLEPATQPGVGRDVSTGRPAASGDSAFLVPAYATQLDDVNLLFRIATDQSVTLGPIEYRSEPGSSLPVVVRELDLRLNEEYPKLKVFLAELLKQMPHLYVREIQVELGTGAAAKVRTTLKLSMVYQAPAAKNSPSGSTGVPAPKSNAAPAGAAMIKPQ